MSFRGAELSIHRGAADAQCAGEDIGRPAGDDTYGRRADVTATFAQNSVDDLVDRTIASGSHHAAEPAAARRRGELRRVPYPLRQGQLEIEPSRRHKPPYLGNSLPGLALTRDRVADNQYTVVLLHGDKNINRNAPLR